MGNDLKSIVCNPDCGFMAQSHDEKELMDIARMHGKRMHNMDSMPEKIKAMIKPA